MKQSPWKAAIAALLAFKVLRCLLYSEVNEFHFCIVILDVEDNCPRYLIGVTGFLRLNTKLDLRWFAAAWSILRQKATK